MIKKRLRSLLPVFLIIGSFLLLMYPYISEYLFEHRADSQIAAYQENVADAGGDAKAERLQEAQDYNRKLSESQVRLTDPFIEPKDSTDLVYELMLSLDDTGIMAYIEIPVIDVYLPVYHGTSAAVLESGVGHLEGTSLPTGGEGTHAVLTGHTGLNHAKLFTDLTELACGDIFYIHLMGETLAYTVYDTEVVLPEQTDSLRISKKADIITLVTCTPYGVNTHRLLVHGRRTDYTEAVRSVAETQKREAGSRWMTAYRRAACIGIMTALAMSGVVLATDRKRYLRNGRNRRCLK